MTVHVWENVCVCVGGVGRWREGAVARTLVDGIYIYI